MDTSESDTVRVIVEVGKPATNSSTRCRMLASDFKCQVKYETCVTDNMVVAGEITVARNIVFETSV